MFNLQNVLLNSHTGYVQIVILAFQTGKYLRWMIEENSLKSCKKTNKLIMIQGKGIVMTCVGVKGNEKGKI